LSRITYIAVVAIMTVVFLALGIQHTKADLGPVHVELNTTGDKPSSVRANSVTAFKIHIRFNMTIKSHDWVKIWFPIDEASCDPKDICDGLPKITGDKEHPRFVPNERYFAKYPNSELKKIGKLYQVLDDRKGNTKFDECECATEGNCCTQGKCRIIPDPSGLGCWIMGTVLPPLPRDESERYYRFAMIQRSTSLAYYIGDESQGLPFITNTCSERSYQLNSAVHLDAWRKGYNPVDFNTSKATGILAPATPGRYTLMVATKAEPTPVESEAFVIPCSQISPPKVEFLKMNPDYPAPFKVKFTTGEGGALDKENSNISIRFPEQFFIPNPDKIKPSSVLVNGQKVTKKLLIDRENRKLVVTCPVDINAFGDVEIEIKKESGIRTPKTKGNYRLEMCTDSEPDFVSSEEFQVELVPSAHVTPNIEFFNASYSLLGIAPKTGIDKGSEISINFPEGTYFPPTIDPKKITINNTPCEIMPTIVGTKLLVKMPIVIKNYIDIEIDKCGILNPPKGNYPITLKYKEDIIECGKLETIASKPYISSIQLTSNTSCENVKFIIKYYPSTTNLIFIGDKLTIVFPTEYRLPRSAIVSEININGKTPQNVTTEKNLMHIISSIKADFRTGMEIIINEYFGIINPGIEGIQQLFVIHNNLDSIPKEFILKSPNFSKTEIETEWPEDTKKAEFGGYTWNNATPTIKLFACNPRHKIYSWFADSSEELESSEITLDKGVYLRRLIYYSNYYGYKENGSKVDFAIDTDQTICNIEEFFTHIYTNKMNYIVKVNRHFARIDDRIPETKMTERYIIDGVEINDEIITMPEISSNINPYETKMTIEKNVMLKEGDNIIEISSFDQFGESDTKKITVTRDTKPPQMSIKNPNQNSLLIAGEEVEIVVETDADAEIDLGKEVNIDDILENGSSKTYKAKLPIKVGKNEIIVGVHDRAGNWTTKKLVFYGILPMVSEFFLGNTNWTLNDKEQAQMKSPPTNSSPPLPKDLAGTTYMPAGEIGFTLSTKISWDTKSKKVTISQSLPNGTNTIVEVWVSNKKAKVNGKDVWIDDRHKLYPVIVNGKTMLPLRFVGENLNADVAFDAVNKKITINFPSAKIIGKQEGK
jgi:hypothetical protein